MATRNLGGRSRLYDNRDLHLGAISGNGSMVLPVDYKTDVSMVRRLYQNGWPACGSHAGATLKAIQEWNDIELQDGCSPRCLWRFIKTIDGLPLEVGTDMRYIFKALYSKGVCKYSSLPNDNYLLPLDLYSNPTITDGTIEEAQELIIKAYGFLPSGFTLDDLKTAIYQNKAVLLLIRCDDGFFGNKIPSFTTRKYGHFVVAYGYSDSGIYIMDSTEANFDISLKTIMNSYFPFIQEVGTAVDADTEEIRKLIVKKNLLTKIVELYKQAVALALQIKK